MPQAAILETPARAVELRRQAFLVEHAAATIERVRKAALQVHGWPRTLARYRVGGWRRFEPERSCRHGAPWLLVLHVVALWAAMPALQDAAPALHTP